MKHDSWAVGGFFEDLPVLAFVLAGVMSVACAASWSDKVLREEEQNDSLESVASQLVLRAMDVLQGTREVPTAESVRCADLTRAFEPLPSWAGALMAFCIVHPCYERLLVVSEHGGDPVAAFGAIALINVLCDDGSVGILEVSALVWEV